MVFFLSAGVDEGVILPSGFLKVVTFRERVLAYVSHLVLPSLVVAGFLLPYFWIVILTNICVSYSYYRDTHSHETPPIQHGRSHVSRLSLGQSCRRHRRLIQRWK